MQSNLVSVAPIDQAYRYQLSNNLTKAAELYKNILTKNPQDINALHLLGLVELQQGHAANAETYIRQALYLAPQELVFYLNLGIALQRQKKYLAAEELYLSAIQINAHNVDLYFNLGIVFAKQGKLYDARRAYEYAISLDANNAKAYSNLAGVFLEMGQLTLAVDYYLKTLQLDPKAYRAANNLGNIYFNYYGNLSQASLYYQKSVAANGEFWESKFNLANCYRKMQQEQRAIITLNTCLKHNNQNPLSWYHLGLAYEQAQQMVAALNAYTQAIKLKPDFLAAFSHLFFSARHLCAWKLKALAAYQGVYLEEELYINLLRAQNLAEHQQIAQQLSQATRHKATLIQTSSHDFSHLRKSKVLKIGYVVRELHDPKHLPFLKQALQHHDRSAVSVFVYYYGKKLNKTELSNYTDHLVFLGNLDYLGAAAQIYHDQIHCLVDLEGHSPQNQQSIFALKPAPLQIGYLFNTTTGAPWIDYLIMDKVLLQPNELAYYQEKMVLLPHSYQVLDVPQHMPETIHRKYLGLQEQHFVFANFAPHIYLDAALFATWMLILREVPHAILLLNAGYEEASQQLLESAREHGIKANRLQFFNIQQREQYLTKLSVVDLVLDSVSYSDVVTTMDALQIGVPVLSNYGQHGPSRASASILATINASECISNDLHDYASKAIYYAKNPRALHTIKRQLEMQRSSRTVAFQAKRHIQSLEQAYQTIWQQYLNDDTKALVEL